jgi:hypothetical protein
MSGGAAAVRLLSSEEKRAFPGRLHRDQSPAEVAETP